MVTGSYGANYFRTCVNFLISIPLSRKTELINDLHLLYLTEGIYNDFTTASINSVNI